MLRTLAALVIPMVAIVSISTESRGDDVRLDRGDDVHDGVIAKGKGGGRGAGASCRFTSDCSKGLRCRAIGKGKSACK